MTAKTALIVDDSRLAQFVLKKMLVERNMEVETTESAEEAINYLGDHTPDVVFLDHSMPGMNGLDALKIIKNNPQTASIPIVMYTSQEDSSYFSKAQSLGAIDILQKQIKAEELEQILNKLTATNAMEVDAVTEAPAEAEPSPASEDALAVLVRDAEAVIEPEAIEQRLQQSIKQQADEFAEQIQTLHNKVDNLIAPAPLNEDNKKQTFWNNVLWATIYGVTLVLFSIIYFQQKSAIEQLYSALSTSNKVRVTEAPTTTPAVEPTENKPAQVVQPTPQAPPQRANPRIQPNRGQQPAPAKVEGVDLSEVESFLNRDNQIPFGGPLLGEFSRDLLESLIEPFERIGFSGEVKIIAHDGEFCVETDGTGAAILPDDSVLIDDCEIIEPNTNFADISSIEFLQFITATNQGDDNDFIFIIETVGADRPSERYPLQTDELTAGEWNSIAAKNRRLEFQLISN